MLVGNLPVGMRASLRSNSAIVSIKITLIYSSLLKLRKQLMISASRPDMAISFLETLPLVS